MQKQKEGHAVQKSGSLVYPRWAVRLLTGENGTFKTYNGGRVWSIPQKFFTTSCYYFVDQWDTGGALQEISTVQ